MTLRPCREESVDFDNTKNLYIEGDNLEVLKILRETYLGKVKMIYIDPPYNTGNDFVYNDNFSMSVNDYSEVSGESDDSGNRLFLNTSSNGRFHTDWLNMIYPRLSLSKDLLSEDGFIAISIDDSELNNIINICNEIFGEINHIATIVRNTNSSKNQSLFVSVSHEYCVLYARNIECLKEKHSESKWSVPKNNIVEYKKKVEQLKKEGLTSEEITEELKTLTKYPRFIDFTNYWYFDKRGLYRKDNLGGVRNGNMKPIINPLTGKEDPVPPGGFRYSEEKMNELIADERIHFHTDGSLPVLKRYLSDNEEQRPKSIMSDDQRPDYSLLQRYNLPFDNPKQLAFMERLLYVLDKDSVILDFFAGSSTTAHAVMNLNNADHGDRKFIMVQIPEHIDVSTEAGKLGYTNICEIGKERLRCAGRELKISQMGNEDEYSLDVGFRVFKCDSSNFRDIFYSPEGKCRETLEDYVDVIKDDRGSEDLLVQVMLESGIELSSIIERKDVQGNTVFSVDDGYLVACFDDEINDSTVTEISKEMSGCMYAVFRSGSSMTDEMLANIEQIFKTYSPQTKIRIL
ncbi:site-specific DNA-methyltransferase [Methanomethylophilus alvi]|uniref:site-specific DNA-methyltransferase n=2 Tax=Methanomethylophilus alvi TaxID=1291540 RepID=UPI0037DC54F7